MATAAAVSNFQTFLERLAASQCSRALPPGAVPAVRQVAAGVNMIINALKSAPPEGKIWYDEFVRECSEGLAPLLSANVKQATDLSDAAERGALDPLLSRIADSTAGALAGEFADLHAKIDGLKPAADAPAAPAAPDHAADFKALREQIDALPMRITPEMQKILDAFKPAPAAAPAVEGAKK